MGVCLFISLFISVLPCALFSKTTKAAAITLTEVLWPLRLHRGSSQLVSLLLPRWVSSLLMRALEHWLPVGLSTHFQDYPQDRQRGRKKERNEGRRGGKEGREGGGREGAAVLSTRAPHWQVLLSLTGQGPLWGAQLGLAFQTLKHIL